MRIYQLFHEIVIKFVPLSDTDSLELQSAALEWYAKQRNEIPIIEAQIKTALEHNSNPENIDKKNFVNVPKLQLKHQIFKLLESWWMRYLIAIAFIFLVPKVKSIINGESSKEEPKYDEVSEFEEYMKFKRMRHSM